MTVKRIGFSPKAESVSLQRFHVSRFVVFLHWSQVPCISRSRERCQAGVLTAQLSLRVALTIARLWGWLPMNTGDAVLEEEAQQRKC